MFRLELSFMFLNLVSANEVYLQTKKNIPQPIIISLIHFDHSLAKEYYFDMEDIIRFLYAYNRE